MESMSLMSARWRNWACCMILAKCWSIILVIMRFFSPGLYDRLADGGENHPIFKRFYIHKHHGEVGARLLEKIGETSEILSIIAKHDPRHNPFGPETPIEQKILNEADSTY